MNIRRLNQLDMSQISPIVDTHRSSMFNWTAAEVEIEITQKEGYGIFDEQELKGFLVIHRTASAIEIPVLATRSANMGQGVMSQLLQWLFYTEGRTLPIWLEVHENNHKAIGLYKKLGFEIQGRRENYYADGGAAILFTRTPQSS